MSEHLVHALGRNVRTALRRGDLATARALMTRLEAEAPLAKETRGLALELLLHERRLEEADALARQLTELFPRSGRIVWLAGRVSYDRKRYDAAERCFREAKALAPPERHLALDRWLGKALTHLGRFEEAESLLAPLAGADSSVRVDLAWLYERRGEIARAIEELDAYLAESPDSALARRNRDRLRAASVTPSELAGELEALEALGDEIAPHLVASYVEALLKIGKSKRAREVIGARAETLPVVEAQRVGWVCYREGMLDVAVELFLRVVERGVPSHALHRALESAAVRARRLADVIRVYEREAAKRPAYHGRIKRLSRSR